MQYILKLFLIFYVYLIVWEKLKIEVPSFFLMHKVYSKKWETVIKKINYIIFICSTTSTVSNQTQHLVQIIDNRWRNLWSLKGTDIICEIQSLTYIIN